MDKAGLMIRGVECDEVEDVDKGRGKSEYRKKEGVSSGIKTEMEYVISG